MAIKKERSLKWKSETAFFGMKQPRFPVPADHTTQSQVPWHNDCWDLDLSQVNFTSFTFTAEGEQSEFCLAFAASKWSTCFTWRVFIWGEAWLAFAVSGYNCKSLTLMAESINSTLTKRISNACKFLQHWSKDQICLFYVKVIVTLLRD